MLWHAKHFLLQLGMSVMGVDARVGEAYLNTEEAPHNWTISMERDAAGTERPGVFIFAPKVGPLASMKFFIRWDSAQGPKVSAFAGVKDVELLSLGWMEHKALLWALQEWIDLARDTGSLIDWFKVNESELACL